MTYKEAQKFMQGRYNSKSLQGGHTYLTRRGNCFAIQYHNTCIVLIHVDGSYILESAGWRTVTTKQKINRYLPKDYWVFQKDFQWYLTCRGRNFIFRNGMKIGPRGGVSLNGKRLRPCKVK